MKLKSQDGWPGLSDDYVPGKVEMDILERAWVIICNAGGGDWQRYQTPEWVEAAERFRDEVYHPLLKRWVEQSADGP